MYDVRVDFDEFYQEFGIKVTNPVYRNEALPAKHKIMIPRHWIMHVEACLRIKKSCLLYTSDAADD